MIDSHRKSEGVARTDSRKLSGGREVKWWWAWVAALVLGIIQFLAGSWITEWEVEHLVLRRIKNQQEEVINTYKPVLNTVQGTVYDDKIKELSDKIASAATWQYEEKLKERWISALIVFIASGVVCHIYVFFLSLERTLKGGDMEDAITKIATKYDEVISDRYSRVLSDFFGIHDEYLQSVYKGYPRRYIGDLQDFDQESHLDSRQSMAVYFPNATTREYIELLNRLLSVTEHTLFSTAYMPTEKLFHLFGQEGSSRAPVKWLQKVKKRKENLNGQLTIKRVHLFTNKHEYELFHNLCDKRSDLPAVADAICRSLDTEEGQEAATQVQRGVGVYRDWFSNPEICGKGNFHIYKTWLGDPRDKRDFFGDYVIFDGEVVLVYDGNLETMVVYCGNVASHLAKHFDKPLTPERFVVPWENLSDDAVGTAVGGDERRAAPVTKSEPLSGDETGRGDTA